MKELLAQVIFTARSRDPDGWTNILVLVVVAVVYGLGAILKTKKAKKVQEQREEQVTRKPAPKPPVRKPATGSRGVLEQFLREIQRAVEPTEERESHLAAQQAPKKVVRPQPAVRKYAAEAKPASRTQPITPPAKPKLSITAPQVQPDFEELPELQTGIEALPEFTTKTVEGLVGKREDMAAEVPESKYLSEVLADFTDPADLRMAILHYEILGRPISLRDPSGQIIGL